LYPLSIKVDNIYIYNNCDCRRDDLIATSQKGIITRPHFCTHDIKFSLIVIAVVFGISFCTLEYCHLKVGVAVQYTLVNAYGKKKVLARLALVY
jgi:hypothetical protein